MKAYTDLEQSKKLVKILPIETADMYCLVAGNTPRVHVLTEPLSNYSHWENYPCWSLAALFNYLREIDFFPNIEVDEHSISMSISYYDEEEARPLAPVHDVIVEADTFVDACVALIEKLHEQNIL